MVRQHTSRDDLYGSPWETPEEREHRQRRRHAYWRSILSDRDWARIAAIADQVTPIRGVARLEDLDARGIAVGACLVGEETRFSGERIGVIRGKAVLVWMK
jgi:hypothetical protein